MTGTNLNFTDGEMLPVRLCAECPVMSPFKLLCQSCGLSLREARRFLNVRDRIVRHWWNGTLKPPKDAIAQLWHLFQRIDRRAQATVNHTLEQIEVHGRPDFIELAIAGDDAAAQGLDWPCAGAHRAFVRRVMELLPRELAVRAALVPHQAAK
jgi:hypothetical protein